MTWNSNIISLPCFLVHYYYYCYSLWIFQSRSFPWRLSDSKSSQISWTPLGILADLNNALILTITILPLISNSGSLFSKPLGTVFSAPIIIGITVTFMFDSFFSSLARCKYLSIFLLSFIFTLQSARTAKSTRWQVLIFCLLTLGLTFWWVLSDIFVW